VTKRHIHYEAAFEDFIRSRRVPYVAVDEARRALFAEANLKSLDFIVYAPSGPNLLVDVKGRQFPGAGGRSRRYWENWSTDDDVQSLSRWQTIFGREFRSLMVFVYWLTDEGCRKRFESLYRFRGIDYAMMGIWLDDYRGLARVRSPKWQTVYVPTRAFRQALRPMQWYLR